jgi:predicted lipid carrier protein YhbT
VEPCAGLPLQAPQFLLKLFLPVLLLEDVLSSVQRGLLFAGHVPLRKNHWIALHVQRRFVLFLCVVQAP